MDLRRILLVVLLLQEFFHWNSALCSSKIRYFSLSADCVLLLLTSSGWHFEVQPGSTITRLVLLIDNTAFISSAVCASKASYIINDLLKSNSFCFFSGYDFHTWSNQTNIKDSSIHAFFVCKNNKALRGASISLIVWLVLPRNVINGGNVNSSAATVRTTVTCPFT